MYKVVLVDDEELIVEGMKQLVDWKELGCEIAGIAYDGDEALDIINEAEPDIIITDIRMPAMNGLEMIDRVKEQLPDVVIMIMSGYSDFEYAHQALEKGAACYMLKPVLEKDLRERIQQAVGKLDERRLQKQKAEEITVRLYQLKRGAKENFLRKLIREELSASYVDSMWESMELCEKRPCLRVALLESDVGLGDSGQAVIKFAVDNVIEEICQAGGNCESVSLGDESSAVFWLCEPDDGNGLGELVKQIQDTVQQFCRVSLSAGLSRVHDFPGGAIAVYQEAKNALGRRFYESIPLHIYEGEVTRQEIPYKEVREGEEKLLNAVESQDRKKAELWLGRMYRLMFEHACAEPEDIYTEVLHLLTEYQDILMRHQIENGAYENSRIFQPEYLYQFKTGKELRTWLETVTLQVIDFLGQEGGAQTGMIDQIRQYISKNYQTVTRQNTADYFFLNPSYLSQLFKAETGEVFTDYVTRVRMEEAKRLLTMTDYKIQYIAELVGYTSNQHFTRTFKKYAGMQPVEYRKTN